MYVPVMEHTHSATPSPDEGIFVLNPEDKLKEIKTTRRRYRDYIRENKAPASAPFTVQLHAKDE